MFRPKLKSALFGSLLLHLGVLVALSLRHPPAVGVAPHPSPARWVVVDVAVAPAPKPPKIATRPPVRTPASPASSSKAEATAQPAAPAQQRLESDEPRAAPTPSQSLSLFPVPSLAAGTEPAEAPHGRTIRPDDPGFRPEVLRAETEHRVKERVQGWAEDGLADARARGGLAHPYFTGLRDAAVAGLGKQAKAAGIKATIGEVMRSAGTRYANSAESYAKTGDPNLGPAGINPRPSEQLGARFGSEPDTLSLRALAQATETQNDLSHGKPLLALTLELRQFKDGRPLTASVLFPSSDSKFDAFVLEAWPKAIASAGPPPPDAFHGSELRSIWAVEGWLGMSKKLEAAVSYLPMPGVMGLGADKLLPPVTEEGYHYEFHARLLRLYQ